MPGINTQLRSHCLELFQAGIAAADPYTAVQQHLLHDDQTHPILANTHPKWRHIHLIAFGKAACTMMDAARHIIPTQVLGHAIVITNEDNLTPLDHIEVYGAGHPLPNIAGIEAAQRVADIASNAQADELLVLLISGGGSALLPCPVDGISLDNKMTVTRQLLHSGATIHELNCVRKHLSRLKGGGLARLAHPAHVHALILSDVVDDDPSVIASGPTIADETTFADAIAILRYYRIWEVAPQTVRIHLERGARGLHPETLKNHEARRLHNSHTIIGSNRLSIDALQRHAEQIGYRCDIYHHQLNGEAREVAEHFAAYCKTLIQTGLTSPTAVIAGGETTVTVTGSGMGGRNQEFALAFALAADNIGLNAHWSFLSGGSDGRDGPTNAAGGLVDAQSLSRMVDKGLNPLALLQNNDAYHALQASNDLLLTGTTGTNVADLQIALLYPTTEFTIPTGDPLCLIHP